MTALKQATSFNVEASLNEWMRAALAAFSLPAWITTLPTIVYDFPQVSAAIPCFSFVHLPVDIDSNFQGKNVGGGDKGGRATGIMDVSCWVSRSKAPNSWYPILMILRDFVLSTAEATSTVVISDYQTSLSAPAATVYKINIDHAAVVEVVHDPNLDVERKRILIDYSYVYRA